MNAVDLTGWLEPLVEWAWARHHNILSWYVRPLFLIPFCWFAYRRNLVGLVLTVVALVTSMAWFPEPDRVQPGVETMLQSERDYLLGEWGFAKVAIALLIPLVFAGVALALWRRSLLWALVVINAAVLFKVAWTFMFSTTEAAMTHLPAAIGGLAVVDALLLGAGAWLRRRRLAEQPAADRVPAEVAS